MRYSYRSCKRRHPVTTQLAVGDHRNPPGVASQVDHSMAASLPVERFRLSLAVVELRDARMCSASAACLAAWLRCELQLASLGQAVGRWKMSEEGGGIPQTRRWIPCKREPGVGQPCRYPPLSPEIPASQASSAPGKPWLSRGRVEEGIPYSVFRHLFLIFLFPFPSFASFLEGGIYNGLVRHRYGLACNYRYCIPEHRDWVVCFLHPPGCH